MIPTSREPEISEYPRLETDQDGMCWLVFDDPGHRRNVLTERALVGLRECLVEVAELATRGDVASLVVWSPPEKGFIIGTDVARIEAIQDQDEARKAVLLGQRTFQLLADLEIPTIAAIDGPCLGGGTELALACGWRVASSRESTRLAFPEVRLGIFPAWGGTTRLPRLIGLRRALPLVLSGRSVTPSRAMAMGLVDGVLQVDGFRDQVRDFAAGTVVGAGPRRYSRAPTGTHRRRFPGAGWLLESTAIGRRFTLRTARREVMRRTSGHYPAPLKALDVIGRSLGKPVSHGLHEESVEAVPLIVSPTSKNLIHLFNMQETAKAGFSLSSLPWGGGRPDEAVEAASGEAPPNEQASSPPTRIGVRGGGALGGLVAYQAASRGIEVQLADSEPVGLAEAFRVAKAHLRTAAERGRIEPLSVEVAEGRIRPLAHLRELPDPEVMVVMPPRETSQASATLPEIEGVLPDDAVLVSALFSDPATGPPESLAHAARSLARPHRFCGIHFIGTEQPAPLVEVVQTESTAPATLATAHGMIRRMGKTPVVIRDAPGLLVHRLLTAAREQVAILEEEGISRATIGRASRAYGWDPKPLGLPEGGGVVRGEESGGTLQDIQARITLAVVNEAASLLADGVASRSGDVDLAMVMAGGFPAFRGGLLRHADAEGPARLQARLLEAQENWGKSFSPTPLIRTLAESGRTFYETFA